MKRMIVAIVLIAIGFCAAADAAEGLTVSRPRCEYLTNPLGIDETSPRLSWIVASPERGARQTAYRVLVASSREKLDAGQADRWDSGRVASDQTAQVVYSGQPLSARDECWWKVMAWDQEGRASAWSEPARWTMGLLDETDWQARWIGLDRPGQTLGRKAYLPLTMLRSLYRRDGKVYLPCPFLRKNFTVDRPVKSAMVYVTALGLFELHLNGQRVSQDVFTPGWSDFDKRVYYLTYDVTDLIGPGDNAIGAILSDGWYAGNIGLKGQRFYGSRPRLMAQIQLEYEDGSREVVATDESWRATEGPIREADLHAGEVHDARLELLGWSEPGFDDRAWKKVDVTQRVKPLVQAYPTVPVRRIMEIKPIDRTEPQPGVYVFNLGQNFAGRARLKVEGAAGDKVTLRFAELLNADGTIYTKNLRSARATDTYILKGEGVEEWEPSFTFHGFQYIEVTGYPGEPDLDAVTGIVLHSDLAITGAFECSLPLVNKLYSNLTWGQRSNYLEVPTDCPQRDERLGWTGDAEAFVRTASYNMDVAPFFTKWMVDLTDGQAQDGAFPDVAPDVTHGRAAGWGDAGVICPWNIHQVYGDTRILEKHHDAMAKYLDFLDRRSVGDISPPLGTYGDWLNVKDPTPLDLIATAYRGHDSRLMAEIDRAIGRDDEAEARADTYENVRRAFTDRFVDADGKIKGDSQTAYLMALGFRLLPDDRRDAAAKQLVGRIEDRDGLLSSGFLGVNLLLPVLTDIGRPDLARGLLIETRYPSWGYTINQGATTIWERWNSYTIENGFNDPGMNSFNHYAFGSCGAWMFASLAGIDTDGPAYRRVVVHPHPGPEIEWVKASYDSIRGPIRVHWRQNRGGFTLDVVIPANATAVVFIPGQDPAAVTESGRPAGSSPGVDFLRLESDATVWEIESGNYSFSVPAPGAGARNGVSIWPR